MAGIAGRSRLTSVSIFDVPIVPRFADTLATAACGMGAKSSATSMFAAATGLSADTGCELTLGAAYSGVRTVGIGITVIGDRVTAVEPRALELSCDDSEATAKGVIRLALFVVLLSGAFSAVASM
jgi:hypothetical protein